MKKLIPLFLVAVPAVMHGAYPVGIANVMGAESWQQMQKPPYGVYSIPMDGSQPVRIAQDVVPANFGAVYCNGLYFVIEGIATSESSFITNYIYNAETWEKITDFRGENITAFDMAWNEDNGKVYGYFHDFDDNSEYFGTINIETGTTQKIGTLPFSVRAMSFDSEGVLYAIESNGGLYIIDTETSGVSKVGDTGCMGKWTTSGAIDGSTRSFYYVTCNDESSDIYVIDIDTAEATHISSLYDNMELAGLYFAEPSALPGAPAKPEMNLMFSEGNLEGNAEITLPDLSFAGSSLLSSMTYSLLLNGEVISTGSGNPGELITVPVTVPETGEYSFVLRVNNEEGSAPVKRITEWIGPDVPAQLAYVNLTYNGDGEFVITWPEATSLHGGWFDSETVNYKVERFGDTNKTFNNITSTTLTDKVSLPYEDEYATYHYEVTPLFGSVKGSSKSSEYYTIGSKTPPFVENFNARWDLGKFTIFQGENSDNERWYYDSNKAVSLVTFTEAGGDDYLLLPPLMLDKDLEYPISFDIKGKYASDTECIEVLAGLSPTIAGLDEQLLAPTDFKTTEYFKMEFTFQPEKSGAYFIAIHAISEPYQGGITIDNISVGDGYVGINNQLSDSEIKFVVTHFGIELECMNQIPVSIYDITGRTIVSENIEGNRNYSLPTGFYILNAGEKRVKFAVK